MRLKPVSPRAHDVAWAKVAPLLPDVMFVRFAARNRELLAAGRLVRAALGPAAHSNIPWRKGGREDYP
jgi:hypothetical protein